MGKEIIKIVALNYTEAILFKSDLELAGVECFLKNVNLIQPDIGSGVEVWIDKNDAENALQILDDIKKRLDKVKNPRKKTSQIKKILVPVDFSEYSKNACLFALDFAEKLKAEIHLFHVYFNPAVDIQFYDDIYAYQAKLDEYFKEVESYAEEALKSQAQTLKDQIKQKKIKGVKVNYSMTSGIIADEILTLNRKYQPGLVVLGTKGKGEKINDIVGSVTAKIIKNSDVPILAIPSEFTYSNMKAISNILYATDFDDSDPSSLRKLMSIVAPFDMKIFCVHFETEHPESWEELYLEGLKDIINDACRDYKVECDLVESINIMDSLDLFIEHHDIGLLSMTTHKRNIIARMLNPSITKKIFEKSTIPMLVFHD
jgi:nucleotide-binding universal stress UspA family protein